MPRLIWHTLGFNCNENFKLIKDIILVWSSTLVTRIPGFHPGDSRTILGTGKFCLFQSPLQELDYM